MKSSSIISEHSLVIKSFEISHGNYQNLNKETHPEDIELTRAVFTVFKIAIPSSLTLYVEYMCLFLNVLFIGFVDDPILLGGLGLGIFLVTHLMLSWGVGLCGGLDTLVSQAFGRNELKLCGTYLNTSRIILCILFVPQFLVLFNSKYFLVAIGQPEETAEIAQTYARISLIGEFFHVQFEATRRFLMNQGIFTPVLYCLAISTLSHIVGLFLAIFYFESGVEGVATATLISATLSFVLVQVYVNFNKEIVLSEKWFFQDIEAVRMIPEYLKYGLSTTVMTCLEWLGYDILNIFAGLLGPKKQTAFVIMMQVWYILAWNSFGITYSCTGLIGSALGENKPKTARKYSYAALIVGYSENIVLLVLYTIFRSDIISLFTTDEEINDLINGSFVLYLTMVFNDLSAQVCGGIVRAVGAQNKGAIIQITSLWVIAVPSAFLVGVYFEYGFKGLWYIPPFGVLCIHAGYVALVLLASWKKVAAEASTKLSALN
ncbi:unnamed protein product [Moneuplotes crassus]|uniref:Uncharacterized protein n=1 Tax=Euplotes crassus TaxID=5936 RepID=A0AAD1UN51_EUPCR|nr:unnamed protein product [Moneuplotes crassus]